MYLVGEILNVEDDDDEDDLDGLTTEEIAQILEELEDYDEVEVSESYLKELDAHVAEDGEFVRILSIRRLPCSAHKVVSKVIVYKIIVSA